MAKPGRPTATFPPLGWPEPAVPFAQSSDGRLLEVGERIGEWTGQEAATLLKHPDLFWSLVLEEDREPMRHWLGEGIGSGGDFFFFRLRHAETGRIHHIIEWPGQVSVSSGAEGVRRGVWWEVSLVQRMRARLSQGIWKENMERLTGGWIHDLNNVLAGMGSLVELSLMDLPEDNPHYDHLRLLKENSLRAAKITGQVTRILHAKRGSKSLEDLNQVIDDATQLVRPSMARNIQWDWEPAAEALPVWVEGWGLRQVFFGLSFNAAAAIHGKGNIRVRTGAHERMPSVSLVCGQRLEGACVSLALEDTGVGIAPEESRRMLGLDYTGMPGKAGLGLGLAEAADFCLAHGGAMHFSGEPGRGARVELWLPRVDLEDPDAVWPVGENGPRKLLLAGDQAGALAGVLARAGYSVVQSLREPHRVLWSGEETFDGCVAGWSDRSDWSRDGGWLSCWDRGKHPVKLIMIGLGPAREILGSGWDQADLSWEGEPAPEEVVAGLARLFEK